MADKDTTMTKSINELVSEASKNIEIDPYLNPITVQCYAVLSKNFIDGATFATNLTFERVVEALKEYHSDNGPYRNAQWWADWLLANKDAILK